MQTQTIEEPARQTPVVARADVVVIGGGIAGLAAAVSSAKNGAKTLLVEAQHVLGGTILGGSSVLNSFTNNPKLHPQGRQIQLVRGFGQEIIDRMSAGAALCAKGGVTPRELDVPTLQDALQNQGVYLEREVKTGAAPERETTATGAKS